MLLKWMDQISHRIRRSFGKSKLLGALSREASEELRGVYRYLSDAERKGASRQYGVWQMRFRRRALQWQERSILRCALRVFWNGFLESQVGAVGVFLLAFGGVALLRNWLTGLPTLTSASLLIPLILVLSAVPLLLSTESCSEAIRSSKLLSNALIGFCGIPESQMGSFSVGKERRGLSLFLGILLGLISIPVHPAYVLAALLLLLFCALAFTVPEISVFLLFLLFPFFELLPHPTVALSVHLLLCTLVWLGKTVSGKRQAEFGFTDCLVLILVLLFLLSGFVTAGSRAEGFLRAFFLFSAWFPACGLLSMPRWQKRSFLALLASTIVCAAYGIGQYVLGKATLAWVDLSRFSDIGGRVCSFFDNPNVLAVFLLLTVPIALGMMLGGHGVRTTLFSLLALIVGSL